MVFTRAGPAEILRSAQKDDLFSKKLQSALTDIVLRCGGSRFVVRYKPWLEALGYFLYYGNTTLSGLQTLGEEYTGIIQVDSSLRTLPSILVRMLMLILDCFGALVVLKLLTELEKRIKKNQNIVLSAKNHLLEFISILRILLPFVSHAHKALFYCIGGSYHLAKRMTGINYVLMRYWLKDRDSLYGFRILGLVTTAHLVVFGAQTFLRYLRREQTSREAETQGMTDVAKTVTGSHTKCTLCLETLSRPGLTPCGHLFCWSCLHEWLQSQPRCPLCRESFHASRVIPLMNYS